MMGVFPSITNCELISWVFSVRVWRIRGFNKHLVFYRLIADSIEVLHVLHGSRDLPVILDRIEDGP